MIKILIVEDGLFRRKRVEEAITFLEGEYESVDTLEKAINILEKEKIDGIVTDMFFPIDDNSQKTEKRAGDQLLSWLNKEKKEIPVLGISTCGFSVEYPQIKGRMHGCVDFRILKGFVSSIKEGHN